MARAARLRDAAGADGPPPLLSAAPPGPSGAVPAPVASHRDSICGMVRAANLATTGGTAPLSSCTGGSQRCPYTRGALAEQGHPRVTSGQAPRGERPDASRRPGDYHDLTGQIPGSPHHGTPLDD